MLVLAELHDLPTGGYGEINFAIIWWLTTAIHDNPTVATADVDERVI
jgi:hypothetical protein